MIRLPKAAANWTAGAVTRRLLDITGDSAVTCAQYLMRAALHVMVDGWYVRSGDRVEVRQLSEFLWKINDITIEYIPIVDAGAVDSVQRLAQTKRTCLVVTPPIAGQGNPILLKSIRNISVMSIDAYMDLRALFTSWDVCCDIRSTRRWLYERYNFECLNAERPELQLFNETRC